MQDEMESLEKNGTWDLVKLPIDKKPVRCKWIFKRKERKYCSMHDYELEQLDVKTAFLHGELDENIYMDQPEGFVVRKENLVCKLKKSLYGLKQSPRQWYKKFDSFMLSNAIYLLLYVDDMLIAAKEKSEIAKLKAQLNKEFEMKDLGEAKKILGMEIIRDRKSGLLYLGQRGYIEKVLRRFNMHNAKPVSTPLAAHFRLSSDLCPRSDDDIEYMSRVPYSSAWLSYIHGLVRSIGGLLWIFRICVCFQFGKSRDGLVGYVEIMLGDLDKRRSLTGYVFIVGGCLVSWKACLQATVALSTTEAEYMAISEACKEAIWLRGLYSNFVGLIVLALPYIVIVKVLFISQKIRCFMREQSILIMRLRRVALAESLLLRPSPSANGNGTTTSLLELLGLGVGGGSARQTGQELCTWSQVAPLTIFTIHSPPLSLLPPPSHSAPTGRRNLARCRPRLPTTPARAAAARRPPRPRASPTMAPAARRRRHPVLRPHAAGASTATTACDLNLPRLKQLLQIVNGEAPDRGRKMCFLTTRLGSLLAILTMLFLMGSLRNFIIGNYNMLTPGLWIINMEISICNHSMLLRFFFTSMCTSIAQGLWIITMEISICNHSMVLRWLFLVTERHLEFLNQPAMWIASRGIIHFVP
ncbi:hypothetical protein U9M48_005529 [Paspalum notatum var. saurae]|uniref:Reverse transcriptase Ty1/copia-type domain-containing protein n=1 Tax=Paspalum notatum var. saurae TaxID=547442 RepID=A0AAQ3SLF2_PASNO